MSAVTDPIADMLTRIRNGIQARHPRVDMPSSKLKVEVARILKEEGYISNFKVGDEGKKKVLKVFLKYAGDGTNAIASIDRVSKRWSPRLRGSARGSAHPGRPGSEHPHNAPRSADRQGRSQGGSGRRSAL